MKKFKYFAVLLLSALCIFAAFAFGGCKEKDSYYVNDSFTCEIESGYISYYVEGEFKIYLGEAGKYTIKYTISTDGPLGKQSETRSTKITVIKSGEQTISVNVGFEKPSSTSEINSTAEISSIGITKEEVEADYTPYAIGFGVTAGAILICAVVVFILDKTGVLKKRK